MPAEDVGTPTAIKKHSKETSKKKIAFIEKTPRGNLPFGYCSIIIFIIPLLLSWHIYKKREVSRKILILQTVYCFLLAYFLFAILFSPFYIPLLGGYILLTLGFTYFNLTLIEWYRNITGCSNISGDLQ